MTKKMTVTGFVIALPGNTTVTRHKLPTGGVPLSYRFNDRRGTHEILVAHDSKASGASPWEVVVVREGGPASEEDLAKWQYLGSATWPAGQVDHLFARPAKDAKKPKPPKPKAADSEEKPAS